MDPQALLLSRLQFRTAIRVPAVAMHVILDGFDLGVGILFP